MKNLLKAKLDSGQRALGIFSALGGAVAPECIGLCGLDYFILDTEHGILDEKDALSTMLAAKTQDITPLVRLKDASRPSVLKMLDLGAMGVIIPFIENIEQVEQLISYAKYPPLGTRGYGLARASAYGCADYAQDLESYFSLCNQQTLLLPQCETVGCLNDIERIAALEGVDGIFAGPYDLSVSLGIPGQFDNPILLDALKRIARACLQANKYSFIFAGATENANRFLDMGYQAVCCGVDTMLLIQAIKRMAGGIKL